MSFNMSSVLQFETGLQGLKKSYKPLAYLRHDPWRAHLKTEGTACLEGNSPRSKAAPDIISL